MDLEKAARYHLGVLRAENRSPATQRVYNLVHRQLCAYLQESLGRAPALADLTVDNAREWQAHLRAIGSSPVTIHGYVNVLRTWTSCLVNDLPDLFPSGDPLAKLRPPKVPKTIVTAFSPEQIKRMADLCAQSRDPLRNRAIVLFMADTGVRAAELCALRLDQIDGATRERQGRALIMGKGRKERFVAFGMETYAALCKYTSAERYDRPTPWLFLGRATEPLTPSGLGKIVRELGGRAGIEGMRCSPHIFRHSFAREFLRAHPGQLLQLQQLLGHSNLGMVQHYARLVESDVVDGYQSVVDGWRRTASARTAAPVRPIALPLRTPESKPARGVRRMTG